MDLKYLSAADQEECRKFVTHHFVQLAAQRRVPLYHYTTGQSLIAIIESGKLWHAQIACMNDSKEVIHSVDLARGAIAGRLNAAPAPSPEFKALLEKMDARMMDPRPENVGVFISCFSEAKDDLSQWRAYGGPAGGYCIEFDTQRLLEAGLKRQAYLIPVTYGGRHVDNLMNDILIWSEEFLKREMKYKRAPSLEAFMDEFVVFWLGELAGLSPHLKHPAFKAEREWRLVYYLKTDEHRSLKFIQRQTMMSRHMPLAFADADEHGYTPLPIKSVMVGPTPHPQLSRIGVGDLLASKGYKDVDLTATGVPYRSAS